jgi:hypothetical protein
MHISPIGQSALDPQGSPDPLGSAEQPMARLVRRRENEARSAARRGGMPSFYQGSRHSKINAWVPVPIPASRTISSVQWITARPSTARASTPP